ncbi:MAG: transcriptional repressor [Dehalococcoidia bacterium]|nr:transcriptional repressor [Dehalococcoidia bacterium]
MVSRVKQKASPRQMLNSWSQRVTAQRTLLLELLRQSDEHLDADELYLRAREKYPRISLSTVYRNLQLFKKLGVIEEHHFAEEHHHYEVKPATEHQHLLCLSCGKIVEFACSLSQKFKKDVGRQYDFDVTGVEVRMTGLCSTCREGKNQKGG